jgi:hypothetical protein
MDEKYSLPIKEFAQGIFTEPSGLPSSSRILSYLLSLFSACVIASIVHHMYYLPCDKLAIWVSGFPYMVGSLTLLSTSPYGVNQVASIFSKPPKDSVVK